MSKSKTAQQNRETAQERRERQARERKIVGDHIAELLDSVNWQPADLCRHTDINSGNLSKVLKGEKGVSGYTLWQIEQAVQQQRELRRQRASFRDERSEAVRKRLIPPVNDMMVHDGLSSDRVDGVCESIIGIIKSAYAP